ncbi:hypothetical protein MBLNU13_g01194t1 [Cladosporium sp. NU13]
MAGQNSSIDIRTFRNYLLNNTMSDALYQFLTPREALILNNVALDRRTQADYDKCDTTCQSWQSPFPLVIPPLRHNDFETMFTYFMHPDPNFQNVYPNNPVYAAQLNNRDWVVANHAAGYDGCICERNHFGQQLLYPWNVNNGTVLIDNMCHEHDFQHFVNICQDANRELWWRRTRGRVSQRKRNTGGHGWTRPKGKRVGARGVLRPVTTPGIRRANAYVVHDDFHPAAVPACCCGEKIDARGHARQGRPHPLSPFGEPLTMRVRSCVGCNQFRRRW